jgi:hypothetical protein
VGELCENRVRFVIIAFLTYSFVTIFFSKPNPDNSPSLPQWPPASGTSMKYLQIGNENGNSQSLFQLKENFLTERSEFWMNLREEFELSSWQKGNAFKKEFSLILFVPLLFLLKIIS